MTRELFDRELEAREITRMLEPSRPRTISVVGDSGVGKSVLIEKCIESTSKNYIGFSFKSGAIKEYSTFSNFIVRLNEKYRPSFLGKLTRLKFKDAKIDIPMIGSLTFEVLPESIDSNYCEYLFENLFRAGYRILRIENIELCRDETDIAILRVLSELTEPHLKIIFEVGTLDLIDSRLRHLEERREHRAVFTLSRLDRGKAMGLHRFLHAAEPPPDLFTRTNGLPLAIEHQASVRPAVSDMLWVDERLESLDKDCWRLAYILSNVDDPCPAGDLERIYDSPDFPATLLALLKARLAEEDETGIKFKHPSFRLALRGQPSPSLDRHILCKTLEHREALSDGSVDACLSIVAVAQKLGDAKAVTLHGLKGLAKAYQNQNALEILYFCDVLLDIGALSERQSRVIRMVEIQAMNQLMRPDEAAVKLDQAAELLSGDTRTAVLEAMTLCQRNQKEASNALIDDALPDLDPRSAVVALAIRIANDIPLELKARALTSFEDALALAGHWRLADLEEELVRLSAKLVSPPELAIERMRDHLSAPVSTEVGRARLMHNLGVQEMLVSDGKEGVERLWFARDVFADHGLSFAAYSAVSLAVAEVASGRVEQAMELLIDAQCLCREQYDLFGVLNNLGGCFLLEGHPDKALESLNRAAAILTRSPIPLRDAVLESCLYQNTALAHLKLGNHSASTAAISMVKLPKFVHRLKEREERLASIESAIQNEESNVTLENPRYDKASWMYTRFLPNFLTLSFYDYPFSVISEEELLSLQTPRH